MTTERPANRESAGVDNEPEPTPAARIEALRERYGERPAPRCFLCGGPMELHGVGPDGKSWYCASVNYIGGTAMERDHFSRSHHQTYDRPDADVLWLLGERERLIAELNTRKGDPITRLHNLAAGLEAPLACGHPLTDWCDNCETCGSCRDAEKSASNE